MITLMIYHQVNDVEHWLSSPRREQFFGPLGMSARTFIESKDSNRVGLIVECPDIDSFQKALRSEEAADAMKYDGVRPESMVVLREA
jgi:hypothetical protein